MLHQGSYNSLKIADFGVVSESMRLSIIVTITGKGVLHLGSYNSCLSCSEILGLSLWQVGLSQECSSNLKCVIDVVSESNGSVLDIEKSVTHTIQSNYIMYEMV